MEKRISNFARVRLAWASTMLVVVPLSPGRFGSHRWIEPIWESCLVIYVTFMLVQIRRKLRAPAGGPDDLLVEMIDDPRAALEALETSGGSPVKTLGGPRGPVDAAADAHVVAAGWASDTSRPARASPSADAGLSPAPRLPVN